MEENDKNLREKEASEPIVRIFDRVMSILIGVESADFVFIRRQTGATAGNLSVQLDKLAKAGYIAIEKTFRGRMPCTVCRITDAGRDAFAEYVEALRSYNGR